MRKKRVNTRVCVCERENAKTQLYVWEREYNNMWERERERTQVCMIDRDREREREIEGRGRERDRNRDSR